MPLSATLNARYDATSSVITSYNVAGLLRGKRRPAETIIYSGHYDHLGIGRPDANGDRIYNGAVDNATGTAQVLEQARIFGAEPRTDRSILFLLVTAEEKGLLGSAYYAANPLYPLGRTVAVFNTDALGVAGRTRDFSMSGTARLGLLDLLVAQGAKQGRRFSPDSRPEAGSFYRSDHFSFAKAGVPAISFDSGEDLVAGGTARGQALARDYGEKRYHQPDDEFDASWDFSGIADDARLLHAVGRDLANGSAWPEWSRDSEFRAIRDRSAADRAGAAARPTAPARGERG